MKSKGTNEMEKPQVSAAPRVVVFKKRESHFEQLVKENEHIRSLVLVGLTATAFYLLCFIAHDSMEAGQLYWNVDYYIGGWGSLADIGRAMMLEVLILIAGFLFYPCFMVTSPILFTVMMLVYQLLMHNCQGHLLIMIQCHINALFISIS